MPISDETIFAAALAIPNPAERANSLKGSRHARSPFAKRRHRSKSNTPTPKSNSALDRL
jgi:hypothetical protein